MNNNKSFISLRCPLYDGCHTLHQFKFFNLWIESPKTTPFKLRCNGMRGVCMAMGILINSSYNSCKEVSFNNIVKEEKRTVRLNKRTLENHFLIGSRSLQTKRQSFS